MQQQQRVYSRIARFFLVAIVVLLGNQAQAAGPHSVAREWNEELLGAIRNDFARPTVHARNLFHTAVAMWDSWAVYDPAADCYLTQESATALDVESARNETISYSVYRILKFRFAQSPNATTTLASFDARMDALGYDKTYTLTVGNTPADLGNRIGQLVLDTYMNDGANEAGGYENLYYEPVNEPIAPDFPGNPTIVDPNRWQAIALDYFIDQSGNVIPGGTPPFLSPEWGAVTPFALKPEDATTYQRDGFDYIVYHDPGDPPYIGTATEDEYKEGFLRVVRYSSYLSPDDGVMMDISPASLGNSTLGTNDGTGYDVNPVTNQPYTPHFVPRGDYTRILAEFWADGPDSETPPGHWFTILNYVSDHPLVEKRILGTGPIVSDLEWDVKAYLALGGAMHDVAISVWGCKGWYDYIRPVSAIRYMADLGQSTDPFDPSYHPQGIPLEPGLVEVITIASTAPGERHEHLAGNEGRIAIWTWKGPDYIAEPATDEAGVGWILAADWWPYQRPSFVTPPFAGYVSGHSTYSRAAALVLEMYTGSPYFPGGLGEFQCPQDEFLVFEDGPSVEVTLQWAKYTDAADECSLSRIYGGIHPTQDDIPGRFMGEIMGPDAFHHAMTYFEGAAYSCTAGNDNFDRDEDGVADACDACPDDNPDDSDGDGVCESVDQCAGGNDTEDADWDGIADACDPCPLDNPDDSDSDGVCDSADVCPGEDDLLDSDSNEVADCLEQPIPTVSQWGLVMLALLMMVLAKLPNLSRVNT